MRHVVLIVRLSGSFDVRLFVRSYIAALNARVITVVDGTIFPKLLALFTKYAKLIPPSQLKALKDAKPFFDNSQPLELLAMYNDTDNTVLVTLGRKSYVVSKSVMLIPATLVDDEYKKFKITLDDTVTMKAARAPHLQQIAKENKWQLSLV